MANDFNTGRNPNTRQPMGDEDNSKQGLQGLMKTKTDWLWLAGIIVLILTIVIVWMSGVRSERPDDDQSTVTITNEQKTAITDTVKRYLSTAGTFGFDWSSADDPASGTNIQNVHDQWIQHTGSGKELPAELAQHILTRDTAIFSLTQPKDGHQPVRSTGSVPSNLQYSPLSDAFYVSQFVTKPGSVQMNWKGARTKDLSNGTVQTTVRASWTTQWTRATMIPADNSAGQNITDKEAWKPSTDSYPFKDVRFTLVNLPNSNEWQIASIDDGGNNDLSKYGWMLSDGIDAKYDQTGKMIITANADTNEATGNDNQ